MSRPAWILFILVLLASLAATPSSARAGSDEENWKRLQGIPREQRLRLAGKLKEFDALSPAQKTGVRELDAKLAALPPGDRANYNSVMRRYLLWLRSLPESQQNEINALPPDKRMAVVTRILGDQSTPPRRSTPPALRMADFADFSPYELATQIKIWQSLDSNQKNEVNRLQEPARQRRMQQLGRDNKIAPVARPSDNDEDALLDKATKNGMAPFWNLRKDAVKGARLKARIADHLRLLEQAPTRVTADNLAKFAASLPVWIRSAYDPLPPDEARRRLSLVYRLVYPAPEEYREPKAVAKPSGPTAPTPPPSATPKSGGNAPF